LDFSLAGALMQIFWIVLAASGPILGVAALSGLIIAILQGVTQIQDQTLPQVVKIVAVMLTILLFGTMLFSPLQRTARLFFEMIPVIGR
jgi:type III secretory pathway component EscS